MLHSLLGFPPCRAVDRENQGSEVLSPPLQAFPKILVLLLLLLGFKNLSGVFLPIGIGRGIRDANVNDTLGTSRLETVD